MELNAHTIQCRTYMKFGWVNQQQFVFNEIIKWTMLKKRIIRRKCCRLEGCELFLYCVVDITTAGATLIPNGDKNVTVINIAVVNTGADTATVRVINH